MSIIKISDRFWMQLVALLVNYALMAQVPPDILNLHSPIAHPIRLSGTYGELRGNHFHGGLDIKSANGVWGDPVFAIDDGYIAEIQISQGGFGRALFIRHPKTGLTSIYGHLQEFTKELNEYVYQQQKDHKSFVLDIPFSENQFPVKRGQLIAKMGSTGYSFGPHLHFELKKTGSDISINPDLYGFFTGDKIKPVIKKIAIYQLDHQLMSYNSSLIAPEEISLHDTMEIDAWRIGLGLEAYDPHNGYNKNGIYAATLILDQDTIYNLVLDSLNARDRNLYNTHIDYKRMVSSHEGIHRCFLLPGTRLSANRHQNTDGIIPLFRDRIQRVTLIASDFAGNETSTIFYLRRSPTVNAPRVLPFQHHFKAGQADSLVTAYLKMNVPQKSLSEDLYFQFGSEPVSGDQVFSAQYRLDEDRIALLMPVDLQIRPFPHPDSIKQKLLIARVNEEGKYQYCASTWDGTWLKSQISRFGKYQVIADIEAPTIKLISHTASGSSHQFTFEIKDNVMPAGGLRYNATLDNEWILAEYDLKRDRITCRISASEWDKTTYTFKLLVEDAVGNSTTYDYRLNFK